MLTVVTSSADKTREISRILGIPVTNVALDLPEIQSLSFEEVVEAKAREAYKHISAPLIVDDAGFSIEGLNGFPGPLSKWFWKAISYEGICRLVDSLPNRNMSVTVCIGYFDGEEFKFFRGEARGTIAMQPTGTNGFGHDVVFIHEGDTKTRAELSTEEQDARPVRRAALEELKTYLESRGIL